LSPPTLPTPPSKDSPESVVDTGADTTGGVQLAERATQAAAEGAAGGSRIPDSLVRQPEEAGRIVVNETNKRLVITGPNGKRLVLAALERRKLRKKDFEEFQTLLCDLERQSLVALPPNETSTARGLILGGVIWALVIFGVLGLFLGSSMYWIVGPAAIALAAIIFAVAEAKGATVVRRWTAQVAALLVVLAVGIALPGSAIYFSAGVDQLVQAAYMDGTIPKDQLDLTLLGRGLQLIFLAAVSLLPALLYFLFDRQQLRTLREQFERHMFRLDPSVETLADVRAKYGTLAGEVFGSAEARGGGRLLPGRRSPVLVATIVITLGWLLTMLSPDVGLITDRAGIVQLFQPEASTIVFGFLGAYFFALMTIQRGYARGDLRPKTYTQITVRIFIAIILAWVLQLLPGDDDPSYLLLLAFAAGIVPETAIVWVREGLRGEPGKEFARWMAERDPLTSLEGIDLYDRARLMDEGITNVEGLAHHDLIELLLQTRIPAPRLVDWIDQAILYLHVGSSDVGEGDETEGNGTALRRDALRQLNAHGIRTATDLLQAERKATQRKERAAFLRILPPVNDTKTPPRLCVILDTIRDEEWMANLKHWHDSAQHREETLECPSHAPRPKEAVRKLAADVASVDGNGRPERVTPASPAPAD
jgi:hypothetical protein